MSFRLDHIAIGVRSIEACAPWVETALGGVRREGGPSPGFDWAQWAFANEARLELIEPTGDTGFLHRFIARQGPGVHHVTFKVPNLDAAADRARAAGYDIVGYDASLLGWKECFLHPKQAQGIVVQFAETSYATDPNAPKARAGAVRLLGTRLRARSGERARALWERVLGGSVEVEGPRGGLRFTWPESPMGIRVEIDEHAEPGPVAVELSGAFAAPTTEDVAALFGTPMEMCQ